MSKLTFDPDWVIAPGETLSEWFESMGVPHVVATRYGIPPRTLKMLFRGTQKLTPPIAQKLFNLTGISVAMWLSLEHNFRVGLIAGKHWVQPE